MVGRIGQMRRVLPVVMVGALALLLGRLPTGRLPQVVKGDDALSVVFGDARAVLAQMMIRKSDSYFHGGIDVDCPLHGKCCDCHHDEDHCTAHSNTQTLKHSNNCFPDPWRWINAHVRAPQEHVHLDGKKAVELLPFYWAALRADPHNVKIWTTAIYIASDRMRDEVAAKRLLSEAKALNPESPEIAFAEGRHLRCNGNGDIQAARKCFERSKTLLMRQTAGRRPTEDEQALGNLLDVYLKN